MSLSTSGRTWEEASSPAAVHLARRFESAFRDSCGRRPEPDEFLPDDPRERAGARLALLRADLTLRWESGERVAPEWYRERYSDLDEETLVALVYEEFCLREEADEEPDPSQYYERFPALASRLRRVLDIHGLVGSGQGTASTGPEAPAIPFPEAGQTIAGFYLVEELGRGAFARVFLARERQLADRPVALKVSRTGSREPQTLARLQHTHIVPVHSYRVDPATGLHLLCMPYFGRVTLSRLMADPAVKVARDGADLVEALDRLGGRDEPPSGRSAGRLALTRRTYAQAIAWWGARMAEALALAHDRGVLHRDVKPSNVLLTGDGMPMLLDFNLARETVTDGSDIAAALGGTLDYMAPEHLDELAEGVPGRVDARSDVYGLGVLLYEALVGLRPFGTPQGALTAGEVLLRAAEAKRAEPPWLTDDHPEVPTPLEAVVRRCLEPNPDQRYATAADLAADLQAFADDQPLRFAREPFASRAVRWTRRNRRALAMAVPAILALAVLSATFVKHRYESNEANRVAKLEYDAGRESFGKEEFGEAKVHFDASVRHSAGWKGLESLNKLARGQSKLSTDIGETRKAADAFFAAAEPLRFRLVGFGGDLKSTSRDLGKALEPFFVLQGPGNWTKRGEIEQLDVARRERLIGEVNQLLFMWVVELDRACDSKSAAQILPICDKSLTFAKPQGPWLALRDRLAARVDGVPRQPIAASLSSETTAIACFEWGMLRAREDRRGPAIEWLRRSVTLTPRDYWYHYYLGFLQDERAQNLPFLDRDRPEAREEALKSYQIACALQSRSPWVRFSLARMMYRARGDWRMALKEIDGALSAYRDLPKELTDPDFESQIHLERGMIYQKLGSSGQARVEYAAVIDENPSSRFSRAARLNRAKLDADDGAVAKARAEYDALIKDGPLTQAGDDSAAMLGRAMLALQLGEVGTAESELTELLSRQTGSRAQVLTYRALARLARGVPKQAEADIAEALRIEPTPARARLATRVILATEAVDGFQLDRPDDVTMLPVAGRSLRADLLSAAGRLAPRASGSEAQGLRARLNRAVIFSALNDPRAETEATRAVELAPLSPGVFLTRARIRRRRGDLRSALLDVEAGLDIERNHAQLWELRGLLMTELGNPRAGLEDLNRAQSCGGGEYLHGSRAIVLETLGDAEGAVREWNRALALDLEDPRAFLGRARALVQLRLWDQAVADLEQAESWAGEDSSLHLRIALASLRCVPDRPRQLGRALAEFRRAWNLAQSPRVVRGLSLNP